VTAEDEILAHAIRLLDGHGIPYMVAGSIASSFHGRPRTTLDADIVIDPAPEALDRLVHEFSAAGFYVDLASARDALRARRQFNVIDTGTAFKLDLIIRKDRPFSREEFRRQQRVDLADVPHVAVATAEDTILSKLEWAKKGGGSERQITDVRGIVDVKGRDLDRAYIERWANDLGVLELWHAATRAAS
jgi:hypothetical protein